MPRRGKDFLMSLDRVGTRLSLRRTKLLKKLIKVLWVQTALEVCAKRNRYERVENFLAESQCLSRPV